MVVIINFEATKGAALWVSIVFVSSLSTVHLSHAGNMCHGVIIKPIVTKHYQSLCKTMIIDKLLVGIPDGSYT